MDRPAIHPGEVLADELDEIKMSGAALGRRLHIPAPRIQHILRGQRLLSADTALRLGHFFGTGPELWLNLQHSYDLRLAEQTSGERIRASSTPLEQPSPA